MSIKLTEAAAQHCRHWLAGQDLRFRVKTTGCSGYAYVLEPATATGPEDVITESQDIRIVIDRLSLALVEGTEIDYVRSGLNASFAFHNPNVVATCGCGESFTVAPVAQEEGSVHV